MIRRAHLLIFLAITRLAHSVAAQNADDYCGGWRTDEGDARTYEFSIRVDAVKGIYCTYCAVATTLAASSAKCYPTWLGGIPNVW